MHGDPGYGACLNTPVNHVPSNAVATGKKMFEPAVISIFANVNTTLFVHFSSSCKCEYFYLIFELNFTIFHFKKDCLKRLFNGDISILQHSDTLVLVWERCKIKSIGF